MLILKFSSYSDVHFSGVKIGEVPSYHITGVKITGVKIGEVPSYHITGVKITGVKIREVPSYITGVKIGEVPSYITGVKIIYRDSIVSYQIRYTVTCYYNSRVVRQG